MTHSQVRAPPSRLALPSVSRVTSGDGTGGVQVLQLYVAGYQSPALWTECYKPLAGILSPQIIKDVEAFTSATPFAEAEVMRFLAP